MQRGAELAFLLPALEHSPATSPELGRQPKQKEREVLRVFIPRRAMLIPSESLYKAWGRILRGLDQT